MIKFDRSRLDADRSSTLWFALLMLEHARFRDDFFYSERDLERKTCNENSRWYFSWFMDNCRDDKRHLKLLLTKRNKSVWFVTRLTEKKWRIANIMTLIVALSIEEEFFRFDWSTVVIVNSKIDLTIAGKHLVSRIVLNSFQVSNIVQNDFDLNLTS